MSYGSCGSNSDRTLPQYCKATERNGLDHKKTGKNLLMTIVFSVLVTNTYGSFKVSFEGLE